MTTGEEIVKAILEYRALPYRKRCKECPHNWVADDCILQINEEYKDTPHPCHMVPRLNCVGHTEYLARTEPPNPHGDVLKLNYKRTKRDESDAL